MNADAAVELTVLPRWTRRRQVVSLVVAGTIAVILLTLSLREVEWARVILAIRSANLPLLLFTTALISVTLFLRSVRWRILLSVAGTIPSPVVFRATAASTLANAILPARVGDIVRTVLVRADTGLQPAFILSTALAERVADLVAVVIIASIAMLLMPGVPVGFHTLVVVGTTAAAMSLVIGLGPRLEPAILRVIVTLPLRKPVLLTLRSVVEHGMVGLRTFHSSRRLVSFLLLTGIIWSIDAMATVIGGAALGIEIPWPAAFLLLAYLAFGAVLPSTPAQVGIYQFAAVTALAPFGVVRSDAIAYILVAQALFLVVIGLWGTPGLISVRRVAATTETRTRADAGSNNSTRSADKD